MIVGTNVISKSLPLGIVESSAIAKEGRWWKRTGFVLAMDIDNNDACLILDLEREGPRDSKMALPNRFLSTPSPEHDLGGLAASKSTSLMQSLFGLPQDTAK